MSIRKLTKIELNDVIKGGVFGVANAPADQPEVIHNITSTNNSFQLTYAKAANCDVALVGGGGAGRGGIGEAGGGAQVTFTPGHPLPGAAFPITIAAGGSGVRGNNHGNDGGVTTLGASSPLSASFGAGGSRDAPTGSGGGDGTGGPAGNNGGSPGAYRGGGGGAGSAGSGPPNGAGGNGTPIPSSFGAADSGIFTDTAKLGLIFCGGGVGGGQYGSNNSVGFSPPGGGGHGSPNEGGGEGGNGAAQYGAGGGGDGSFSPGGSGGNGGSGRVLIKEPSGNSFCPGVWRLDGQLHHLGADDWQT